MIAQLPTKANACSYTNARHCLPVSELITACNWCSPTQQQEFAHDQVNPSRAPRLGDGLRCIALCLRHFKQGWTPELKERVLDWYETTHDWEGGNSLQGYLRNIVGAWLEHFSPAERKHMLETWTRRPFATRARRRTGDHGPR